MEKVVRRDFYQMGDWVTVSFYEKGVKQDSTTVNFFPNSVLSLSL